MSVTVKVNRSDVYPVGQLVEAFPAAARIHANKPVGTATTSGTVDAAGVLTLTLPNKTPMVLWAEVRGEHRYVRVGDPTTDAPLPTLRGRSRRRRMQTGAGIVPVAA